MLRSAGVSSKYRSMSLRVVCSLSMAVSRHTRTGGMSMGGMGGPGGMDMASLVSALS